MKTIHASYASMPAEWLRFPLKPMNRQRTSIVVAVDAQARELQLQPEQLQRVLAVLISQSGDSPISVHSATPDTIIMH